MTATTNNNSNEIIKTENIAAITAQAPGIYGANKQSSDRCKAAGAVILRQIEQLGMDDGLDKKIEDYLHKAAVTLKAMNARRSPVTKMLSMLQSGFVSLENDIDKNKAGSITAQLQARRDDYAAFKIEAQRRMEEELRLRTEREKAYTDYKIETERRLHEKLQQYLDTSLDALRSMYEHVTLATYDSVLHEMSEAPTAEKFVASLSSPESIVPGALFSLLTEEQRNEIYAGVYKAKTAKFLPYFSDRYRQAQQAYADRMPSRRANLQAIADAEKADAEKAAAMRKELDARQEEEKRREAEKRAADELAARQEAEKKRQDQQMQQLFSSAAATVAPQTRAKVRKRIRITSAAGIVPVISRWLTDNQTVEDIEKAFRKQITYCEKLADKGEFIKDDAVEYYDEVRAK